MSIASQISRIQNAKASLKASINAKNDFSHQITNETIDNYAEFVDNIQTGGSLQSKTVAINENTTINIQPDIGYDGLSSVSVTTNVPSPGVPTVGTIYSDWDSNGYPHTAQLVGRNTVPSYYFGTLNGGSSGINVNLQTLILPTTTTAISDYACSTLKNLVSCNLKDTVVTTIGNNAFNANSNLVLTSLPNTVTSIGSSAFMYSTKVALTELPSNLTSIGSSAFMSTAITIKTIPTGITNLPQNVFANCGYIKQLSMPNVQSIYSGTNSNPIYNIGIYAIWIGSSLTTIDRYSLRNRGTNIKRLFIDLPRATVEALPGYSYAFMNDASKVSLIVCNDDVGFMNQAQFDAIDWETYTP